MQTEQEWIESTGRYAGSNERPMVGDVVACVEPATQREWKIPDEVTVESLRHSNQIEVKAGGLSGTLPFFASRFRLVRRAPNNTPAES